LITAVRAPTNENPMNERILIAGIGNIFLGDDAFGVEVVRRLAARKLPDAVRVMDFGIRGFDLAYALMEGYEVTILVDATPRGGAPGTLYTIEPDLQSVPSPQTGVSPAIDAHSMDPLRVLGLVKALGGEFNRILIVGCEPEALGAEEQMQGHMGLSDPVEHAVEEAADVIVSLAEKLLAEPCETLTRSSRQTTLRVNP
jgi:hydrogenase maturation protease